MPEFLDEIIKKNLECIKFFKTPNNQTPLFNGASENDLNYFNKYLEKIRFTKKEKKILSEEFSLLNQKTKFYI